MASRKEALQKSKQSVEMTITENPSTGEREAKVKEESYFRQELGKIKEYLRSSIEMGMDFVSISHKAIKELEKRIEMEGWEVVSNKEIWSMLQAAWKAQETNVGFSKTSINIANIAPDVMDDEQKEGDEMDKLIEQRRQNKLNIMAADIEEYQREKVIKEKKDE